MKKHHWENPDVLFEQITSARDTLQHGRTIRSVSHCKYPGATLDSPVPL